jgi:endonuclease-3
MGTLQRSAASPRRVRTPQARPARVLAAMQRAVAGEKLPSVSDIARRDRDPFRILISTLLSLRTKDDVTDAASARLFALAPTVHDLARLDLKRIEKAIFPVGFYRTKARTVRDVARRLEAECAGKVPNTIDALLEFKGVGRKTAALVVSLGYHTPAICVDTHVHRISNRLGWVRTRTPHETEQALMTLVPKQHWIDVNEIMVGFGQRVCTPLSPRCSICPVARSCAQVGVGRKR